MHLYIHPALVCIVLCQHIHLCTPKPFYQPVLEVYEALGTLVHDYLVAGPAAPLDQLFYYYWALQCPADRRAHHPQCALKQQV